MNQVTNTFPPSQPVFSVNPPLSQQVEHIIVTRTGPREYYPQEGVTLELGPTKGCREAIACLETHCKLMRGSTSKDVLEVFYQEVGIRLHAYVVFLPSFPSTAAL